MILNIFYFIIVSLVILKIYSLKFRNPYKLVMIFGPKGSGKNTLLTKLSIQYNKKGYKVFSDSEIFNTYKLSTNWIGKYDFPENSVLMIEEAGITWDNRNFKTFSAEVRNFFKLQRHYNIIVYLASQSFDVDKKLRDLTDQMFLCVNYMGIFSVAKSINKRIAIHNASEENNGESFLTETYSFGFPWEWKYTFIPRWIRYFNSFEAPKNGINAPRDKYKFSNEHELFKSTHYPYYKLSQIQSILADTAEVLQAQMEAFMVSDSLFLWLSNNNHHSSAV